MQAQYTYIIDTKENKTKYFIKTIDPSLANEIIKFQKDYMDKQKELIQTDGCYGLGEKRKRALKIKIRHSKAFIEAVLSDKARWIKDPDFRYEIPDVNAPENAFLLEQVQKNHKT